MRPTLTVIVPTYKRPADLAGFLAHIAPQIAGRADRKLIVVNDGAHDSAYEAVLDRHGAWFTYLVRPQNGGPAAARNYAARRAEGAYLVFTDDDCRAPEGWLDHLQARYEAEPWLDGVAGYTQPVVHNPRSLREWVIAHANVLPGATYDEIGRLTCAVTAAFSVRRAWFERVGGFDEAFRPSGEDLDLTQRLIRAGAILEADPRWRIGHTTADTIKSYLKRYYAYGEGSARYCMTRRDWTHPDLRNYLDRGARRRTIARWIKGARTGPAFRESGWMRRLALWAFTALVARRYAAGFAAGAARYGRAEARPPAEPWLLWPRLGYAADGLPRR